MTYFHKKYHPPGTPPGTLTSQPDPAAEFRIHLTDYTDGEFTDKVLTDIDTCRDYAGRPSTTWIHIQGAFTVDVVRKFGDIFGLHPLAMEDVLNTGQRPSWTGLANRCSSSCRCRPVRAGAYLWNRSVFSLARILS